MSQRKKVKLFDIRHYSNSLSFAMLIWKKKKNSFIVTLYQRDQNGFGMKINSLFSAFFMERQILTKKAFFVEIG